MLINKVFELIYNKNKRKNGILKCLFTIFLFLTNKNYSKILKKLTIITFFSLFTSIFLKNGLITFFWLKWFK